MPRTKVSMRPSGERAGWVTESGKLVSLTYCDVDVVVLFECRSIRPPIASKEVSTMPITIQRAPRPRRHVREVTTAGGANLPVRYLNLYRASSGLNQFADPRRSDNVDGDLSLKPC